MHQVLLRAGALLLRPWVFVCGLLLVVGGCAGVSLPLLGLPGYELGTAMAIGVGLFGGVVGAAAGFQESRLIQGRDPRPRGAPRKDSPLLASWFAFAAALVLNTAFLVPPFVAAVVHALKSTPCHPFATAAFYPILCWPSAVLASAAGVFAGLAARGRGTAILLYGGLLLLSAAQTLWPLFDGPQVYAFNHFAGLLPGPLYDEALSIRPSLWWFRLGTLVASGTLVALCGVFLNMVQGWFTRPHLRPSALTLSFMGALALSALEGRAPHSGFRMTEAFLVEKLEGRRETQHFLVQFARGKPKEEVERLARDLEFRHAQISQFFGGAPEQKIKVFVYRSAEEKQQLVGASRTQFAKPWLLELHVNDAPFPNPALKHELAHVMAAPFGAGPFKATTRFGVWPLMGIIEGTAVAADNPIEELSLHQAAAAMRREKLAPDIRRVLGPEGFFGSAPSRAYAAAGSFLRYLAETYGAAKLDALYGHGDFEQVYGRRLDALATEWEGFLDGLPLDAQAVNQAFLRFRQGSLFARPCAREVAQAQEQAARLLATDPEGALDLYRGCASIQPEEPSFPLAEAEALLRLDRKGDAAAVLRGLLERVGAQPALFAQVAVAQADVAYARGRLGEAAEHLQAALSVSSTPALERTARVKLAGLSSRSAGPAIWRFFRPSLDDLKLLELKDALDREPKNGFASYLLGRRLTSSAPQLALGYLSQALTQELPDAIRREALRLQVFAAYMTGDCGKVRQLVGQLPDLLAALKPEASEWKQRCDFEAKAFGGPLVPDEGFR